MQPPLPPNLPHNLPLELQVHFGTNKKYFEKLLSKDFSLSTTPVTDTDIAKIQKSYEASHRIRDFEIGLYWQRLNYLWAITAVIFAGWGFLLSKILEDINKANEFLYFSASLISILGSILTMFGIFIVKAGRHWQTVWEYHITTLEPFVSGSLYAMEFKPNGNSKKPSISNTLALFNTFVLLFWFVSAIVFAIIPVRDSDDIVQWVHIILYTVVVGAFWIINRAVTKKDTYKIELDN